MRILLVNKFFYHKGGSETYLFALADGLRAMGHEVAFFSMHHPKNYRSRWNQYFVSEKDYNGNISAFRKVKEAATLAYSPEAKRKFEALLEDFRPDIIHLNLVHRQITFSILDAPYLKTHHVPVVYTAHDYSLICPVYTMLNGKGEICDACIRGDFSNVIKNVCTKGSKAKSVLSYLEAEFLHWHKSYNKIDLIIACSQFMKRKLDEAGYADRTVCMQNFLTDSQMAMGQKIANTHKFEDEQAGVRPYFVYFGRLSQEKGILTLVRAFLAAVGIGNASGTDLTVSNEYTGISAKLPNNWDLHIVGDGPERAQIKQLIAQAGPEAVNLIKLLGYKDGEDLQREVSNARFCVLPSQWRENMPYSGLESLAAQTPVIGARIGGIPEFVIKGKTGFTFNSGDMNDLIAKLQQATCISKRDYAHMQFTCQEYVHRYCQQKEYMHELEHLYTALHMEKREQA